MSTGTFLDQLPLSEPWSDTKSLCVRKPALTRHRSSVDEIRRCTASDLGAKCRPFNLYIT